MELLLFIYYIGYVIFVSIPKIFAWLLYDTDILAECCGVDIARSHFTYSTLSIKTYMEYSYNDKGYAKRMFMPFIRSGMKHPIKIRSDKPWKAVSVYEFYKGIISLPAIIPIFYFLFLI